MSSLLQGAPSSTSARTRRQITQPQLTPGSPNTYAEVALCVEAAALLTKDELSARVISMPSWELFEKQDDDYQDSVLGPGSPVLSVEAATSFGWSKWADDSVAIDRFGASAPGTEVLQAFGYTADNVAARARALLDEMDGIDDLDGVDDFADEEDLD